MIETQCIIVLFSTLYSSVNIVLLCSYIYISQLNPLICLQYGFFAEIKIIYLFIFYIRPQPRLVVNSQPMYVILGTKYKLMTRRHCLLFDICDIKKIPLKLIQPNPYCRYKFIDSFLTVKPLYKMETYLANQLPQN